MGDFMHAENADMHHLYASMHGNGKVALTMYQAQFPDECRVTEFFIGYIVNLVKHGHSTLPDMMLVGEELCAFQA
ncbi:hypothetical protein TNCV_140291 [Trichonephila clavipes]|uniref:Uncharacterized protein n=1 Tax=Trichonephila clavipes TaxID=2585209 RepID=A0A8X6RFE6_TRICX|nr:hypothetical protein TNCV_140291 [Trichonephila clavipes]